MVHTSMFAESVGREWHAQEFAKERIEFFRSAQIWLLVSFLLVGIGGFIGLRDNVRELLTGNDIAPIAATGGLTFVFLVLAFALTTKKRYTTFRFLPFHC